MSDELIARLAAIGPYSVVSDEDGEFVATWDTVPDLASDYGPFGLEFRAESLDGGRLEPDGEMFRLWQAWRDQHPAFAARLRRSVEERVRQAGLPGDPAGHVRAADACVCVSRVDDGGDREYTVSATLPLLFDEHSVLCYLDPESGELTFH